MKNTYECIIRVVLNVMDIRVALLVTIFPNYTVFNKTGLGLSKIYGSTKTLIPNVKKIRKRKKNDKI